MTCDQRRRHTDSLLCFAHRMCLLVSPRFSAYTKLVGHSGPVYSTSLSPDGQYLLSGSEDCTARLWNLETKKNIVIYKGHNYPIWDVSFAPLGFYFATASHDATARLWCTQQIAPLRMFVGHNSDVDVVKFHPNCNYIATGSRCVHRRAQRLNARECTLASSAPSSSCSHIHARLSLAPLCSPPC